MKAFVNLLIEADEYDDPEQMAEDAIAAIEKVTGMNVKWHSSKEAED